MANTFTLETDKYDGRYIKLTCTQTQDIANNKSTISWTMESKGGSVNYYTTGPTTLTINGTQAFYEARNGNHDFPAAKGSVSGTITVNHNSDGNKSISISLSTAIYSKTVKTKSGTWTLDAIPRAASISSVTDFADDEDNPKLNYTNYVGNNAATLQAFIYTADEKTLLVGAKNLTKTGTSYTYSLTNAERKAIRTAATGKTIKVRFIIKTTIGTTVYTSNKVDKTISIINANPTASIVAYDTNEKTKALTGNNNTMVKGYSSIYYAITASANKEATITKYYATCDEDRKETQTGTFTAPASKTIKYSVVDSRGNTYANSIDLGFVDYVKVSVKQKVNIELVGETGAKITAEITGHYFNGNFGATNNELVVEYQIAEDGGQYSEWRAVGVAPTYNKNTYSLSFVIENLAYDKSYSIKVKATDKLDTDTTTPYTTNLKPIFDWSNTDFNFNVPISINSVRMNDYVMEEGMNGIWYCRKWATGVYECWTQKQVTTAVTSTWGNLYVSGTKSELNLAYPITFKTRPYLQTSLMSFGTGGLLMVPGSTYGSTTETGALEIARGTSMATANYLVTYYAIGRWK